MVKAPITKGIIEAMKDKTAVDMFAAEPRVYLELLPRLKKKVNCEFGPKSYPCPIKGPMVLQDLKEDGFTLCDRLKQLDFAHCELALKTLAKYHAASVAVYHDDPDFIRDVGQERVYVEGGFVDQWKLFLLAVLTGVGAMIKGSGCEQVGNYILERSATLLDSIVDLLKEKEGHLMVMNHGDLWMNNMLFRHDSTGKATEVKLIDFQVPRYASPALDVLYFIFSSANEEARSRQGDLLDAYRQTLNSCLESLDCEERLTSEEFDTEIKRCANYAVITMCSLLPLVLCDPKNVMNAEELSEDDLKTEGAMDKFAIMYQSKRLTEELPKVVKHFQNQFL